MISKNSVMTYTYRSLLLNVNFLPTFIRLKPNRKVQLHTEDFTTSQIEQLEALMKLWFENLKSYTPSLTTNDN